MNPMSETSVLSTLILRLAEKTLHLAGFNAGFRLPDDTIRADLDSAIGQCFQYCRIDSMLLRQDARGQLSSVSPGITGTAACARIGP